LPDVSTILIERDIPVKMRDGVTLRGDVYRPGQGVCPSLLMRTPYSKDAPNGLMAILDPLKAVVAGYTVFVQDVRGRFKSEGNFTPFANEGPDGYDTVEWVAAQPWSTGRVGMFGSSYMAATQLQAAITAPPHLCAICPIEGSSDYYEGRSYKGGAFELGAMLTIALFVGAAGNIERQTSGREAYRAAWRECKAMIRDFTSVAATAPLADLKKTVIGTYAPFFLDWLEHDKPGPYWESFSVNAGHHKIAVPALHVSSWYDAFSVGTIANYLGIKAHGSTQLARDNQYLWIGPWGHYIPRTTVYGMARLGLVEFGMNAVVDLDNIQLQWFDRWLKDDKSTWRFSSPVRIFVLGDNVWRDEQGWPLSANEQQLFLSAGGEMRTDAPTNSEPDYYRADPANPVPTNGGAHLMLESAFPQGPWDQRSTEARDDVLVYTSKILTEDLEVVGEIKVNLWVKSTAPSTDIASMLSIVRPDGASLPVVDGILRVDLTPGAVTNIEVTLGHVAQTFRSGERIRLRIAGSNFPRHDLNPQTGEPSFSATIRVAADQQVFHDPSRPSAVRLPVVRGKLTGG
jgi:putative CocE/NonD family hydrolase